MPQLSLAENRLLARLPKTSLKRVSPLFVPFEFKPDDLFYEPRTLIDHVYFPVRGTFSVLTVMPEGACIEVATIGREGAVGAHAFLGEAWSVGRVIGQMKGEAMRIKAVDLQKAAQEDSALRTMLMRYHSFFMTQVSQAVACNGLHKVTPRCCRWLLMSHDRAASDEFLLTHEYLAMMLGVRRSSVTETLHNLKEQGFIDYSYGSVKILNRKSLEAACCECYRIVEAEYARLLRSA
jgi:CRP-like cAMP-binding protein